MKKNQKNEKVSKMADKKEVCEVANKKINSALFELKTKLGKVTYLVSENDKEILKRNSYTQVVTFLNEMEENLPQKLDFNVKICHTILIALKEFIEESNEANEYYKKTGNYDSKIHLSATQLLKDSIGMYIFNFLNDISRLQYREIENYLTYTKLSQLKQFYKEYAELVTIQNINGNSMLPLFDIVHKYSEPSELLEPICDTIRKKGASQIEACSLFLEYMNEILSGRSKERTINYLATEVIAFNSKVHD